MLTPAPRELAAALQAYNQAKARGAADRQAGVRANPYQGALARAYERGWNAVR